MGRVGGGFKEFPLPFWGVVNFEEFYPVFASVLIQVIEIDFFSAEVYIQESYSIGT